MSNIIFLFRKYNLGYRCAFLGTLILGVIQLANMMLSFSWLMLNYTIVYFMFAFLRIILLFLRKKYIYIVSSLFLFALTIPLTTSMVLTIVQKDEPNYIFDWIIYAYALLVTIKTFYAIRAIFKKEKSDFDIAVTCLKIISSLFTIVLLEFAMISVFKTDNDLLLLQLLFQGFVVAISISSAFYLLFLHIKRTIFQLKFNDEVIS